MIMGVRRAGLDKGWVVPTVAGMQRGVWTIGSGELPSRTPAVPTHPWVVVGDGADGQHQDEAHAEDEQGGLHLHKLVLRLRGPGQGAPQVRTQQQGGGSALLAVPAKQCGSAGPASLGTVTESRRAATVVGVAWQYPPGRPP